MLSRDAKTAASSKRVVLDAPSWLPTEKVPRWVVIGSVVAMFVVTGVITGGAYLLGWLDQNSLQGLGYPGIFLINFLSTATWFVPIPPVAGHAAIIAGSQTLFKPGVVVAGSAGMTLAESTAYLAGIMGRAAAQEHPLRMAGPLRRWFEAASRIIQRLMGRYGFLTLLVLSAVPNPVFEFAGVPAVDVVPGGASSRSFTQVAVLQQRAGRHAASRPRELRLGAAVFLETFLDILAELCHVGLSGPSGVL